MVAHRNVAARLLLVVLAPLALDGCLSIGVSRAVTGADTRSGSVTVSVHATPKDRDRDVASPDPVFSELLSGDGAAGTMIARSMSPRWSVAGLKPGEYRLRVTRKLDSKGDVEDLGEHEKGLTVRAGEETRAAVVLRKVPVVWIVLAAITVVVLVILSIELAKDGDLPLPPLPPLPPPPFAAVVVNSDVWFDAGHARPREAPPAVADVFPAKGAVVAARRVTVNFLMSTPLDGRGIEKGAVLALGTSSGEIAGTVSYLERDQLLRFRIDQDLQPGESVTVTLDLSKVRGANGRRGDGKVSSGFSVARR